MEAYNYHRAVKADVLDYIRDNVDFREWGDLEELRDQLNDDLWGNDQVTGNGSGSYTFNTWQAEEYICHNLDLLGEALAEFGQDAGYLLQQGAEAADVTIRCYLLDACISEALEELEDEFDAAHMADEDKEV